MRRVGLLAIAAGTLLAACVSTEPRTQVVVTVEAESEVRTTIAKVEVRVLGGPRDGALVESAAQTLGTVSSPVEWPIDVAIVPANADPTRVFSVEAIAFDDGDRLVGAVRARTGFLGHQTLGLTLVLEDCCAAVAGTCDEDQTCRSCSCVDSAVDPDTLTPIGHDAGVDDAAPRDASTSDASTPDAGPPDSGRDADASDAGADAAIDDCNTTRLPAHVALRVDDRCVWIGNTLADQASAADICRANAGRLLDWRANPAFRQAVFSALIPPPIDPGHRVWVGLFNIDATFPPNAWRWLYDGAVVGTSDLNWFPGEPYRDAGCIEWLPHANGADTGALNDIPCTQLKEFVCEQL